LQSIFVRKKMMRGSSPRMTNENDALAIAAIKAAIVPS